MKVLKEKLNLTLGQLITKCLLRDRFDALKLIYDRTSDLTISNTLADDIVNRANKLEKVNKNDWNEFTKDRCLTNATVKAVNVSDVNKLNLCFDNRSKLNESKKRDFANAILQSFCSVVETK